MMKAQAALLSLGLALAVQPAGAADRCESLATLTCQSTPNGPNGHFIDETGYALHYNKNREVARIVQSHSDLIKEKVKSYVDTLERQSAYKRILPYLPGARTACSKTPARCRETIEAHVVELMKFDISGGVVNAKKFDISNLGLINSDDDYGRTRSAIEDAILKDSDTAMEKKLREEIFPMLGERVARVVRSLIPDSPEREAMLTRLGGVQYGGDLCRPLIFGGPDVTSIAHIGAFYDPDKNSVRVCRGFFGTQTSLYPLYNTLAHEMTHSIDPCALLQGKPDQPKAASLRERDDRSPWAGVIACLRDGKSTGARNLAKSLDASECTNDQITESIADFVATEVMAQLLEEGVLGPKDRTPRTVEAGITNIWRYTCRGEYLGKVDPHPSPQSRIERLTAVHPVIRSALGCGALPKNRIYCGSHQGTAMPASTAKKN